MTDAPEEPKTLGWAVLTHNVKLSGPFRDLKTARMVAGGHERHRVVRLIDEPTTEVPE